MVREELGIEIDILLVVNKNIKAMRKFLLSSVFLSASLAIGQAVNFSELKVANTTPSNEQLTGQTLRAHSLMKKAARRVVCVQQSNSEIPADKAEVILEAHKVFGEFAQLGFHFGPKYLHERWYAHLFL